MTENPNKPCKQISVTISQNITSVIAHMRRYKQIRNICCHYRQTSNVSAPNPKIQMSLSRLLSHVLSREWRCSWSSADKRCSNYMITILLPTKVRLLLEAWRCIIFLKYCISVWESHKTSNICCDTFQNRQVNAIHSFCLNAILLALSTSEWCELNYFQNKP